MLESPTRTRASRLHPLGVTRAALALALVTLATPAGADPPGEGRGPEPGVCQDLRVPAGNRVASHVYAAGVQIYRWAGTSWVFLAPEATLFADYGFHGVVGIHYAGPTWESLGGGKVVGAVVDRCTPRPDAIPWLSLRAVSTSGSGIYRRVTYIQRVNTAGGTAPARPGAFVGEVARVPYTAEYYFYRADR